MGALRLVIFFMKFHIRRTVLALFRCEWGNHVCDVRTAFWLRHILEMSLITKHTFTCFHCGEEVLHMTCEENLSQPAFRNLGL